MANTIYVDTFLADVKCYHCSSVLGRLRSEDVQRHQPAFFLPVGEKAEQPLARWQGMRCERCGGPVFLDEAMVVRRAFERYDEDFDRPRRGRPPKRRPIQQVAA
jgi:hypothetical protein